MSSRPLRGAGITALLAVVLSMLAIGLTESPSGAHVPGASATCDGVHLVASNYDGSKHNEWSVTIGDQTQSVTFGSSLDKTFAVPQGGATTAWSAVIQAYNGSYKGTYSGTVGPCGTTANPPAQDISCTQIYRDFGRALVNGDHINVTITRADGSQYQVNVYVDRNIAGGYNTLGFRYSNGTTRPLSQAEVAAGRIWLDLASLVKDSYYKLSFVQINDAENWPNKECGTKPKPDKPAPVNKTVTDTQSSCQLGNQQRTGTQTTDWVFDEKTWTWVSGTTTTTWGNWTTVSPLTPAQQAQLGCATPPPPCPPTTPPIPSAHHGKSKAYHIDKCGKAGDKFGGKKVKGVFYTANGKYIKAGKWYKTHGKHKVVVKAYTTVGHRLLKKWVFHFTTRPCQPFYFPPMGV